MPSSHYFQLNEIVDLITLARPRKLLDIGVGFGKYGFLAREYLELWKEDGDYQKWKVQIDGIEAFGQYITPVHDFIYNKVFIGNALDVLPGLIDRYDLILLIDVFEHFTFEEGRKLLDECQIKGRNILISVPLNVSEQGAVFGNSYEEHKYAWQKEDFRYIQEKFFLKNLKSMICFIGEDSLKIKKMLKKRKLRTRIIGVLSFLHLKEAIKFLLKWA